MLSALLITLLAQSPSEKDACQISGTVELRRGFVRDATPEQVVVFVRHVDGGSSAKDAPHVIQQHNRRFAPRLKVLLAGESADFVNIDPATEHNVYVTNEKGKRFNVGTSKNDKTGNYPFKKVGLMHVRCSIHPEMAAEVFVLQNHYFAVASPNGAFQLPPLPPGKDYEIVAQELNGASDVRKITSCIGKQVQQSLRIEANPSVASGKGAVIDPGGTVY
jgi:plastocyanin